MKLFLLALAALVTISAPTYAQTVPYLTGVPLMPSFQVSDDDIMVFDKPSGRIVEISAWCDQACPTKSTVENYYTRALPPLGWDQITSSSFKKGTDRLSFEIQNDPEGKSTIIVFQSQN